MERHQVNKQVREISHMIRVTGTDAKHPQSPDYLLLILATDAWVEAVLTLKILDRSI